MTDTPTSSLPAIGSLFTLKKALSDLRDHALRVRDTAKGSAQQLAGPRIERELKRKPEVKPDEGILPHLLSQVDDIDAILSDCDDFAESILVLTGKWHEDGEKEKFVEQQLQQQPTTLPASDGRPEPTPADEANIALSTGITELVQTIAGARGAPSGAPSA